MGDLSPRPAASHRRLAVVGACVALGSIVFGPAARPADAAKRLVAATSEADAAAKNAAEPLCKICPCTTRTRTTQTSSQPRAPDRPGAHVHVIFDGSTSFVHANAGPGATLQRWIEVDHVEKARDAVLGIDTKAISRWDDALGGTPGGKPNTWAAAIAAAELEAQNSLAIDRDPVLHWIGLREIDKLWTGPTKKGPRRDVYSPLSTLLAKLLKELPVGNTCDPDVFIVVTDGLEHLDSKTNESSRHSSLERVWSQLTATSRVLLARANPLSSYEFFEKTIPTCDVHDPVTGTRALPTSQCRWVDIEVPLADVRGGKIANWQGYERAVTGTAASSERLKDATLEFLHLVAQDIAGMKACESSAAVAAETTTEYEAQQELPLPPVGDALLLGDDTQWKCTGALVDASAVLTAAHCLPITRVASTDDASQPGMVKRVKEVARPANDRADAALLLLDRPLVAPTAMRRGKAHDSGPQGVLRFVGFGATDSQGRGGFGHRHMVDLTATGWGCDGNRVATTGCVPGLEMVVPGSAGHDTCRGDSGGPLYELWGDGKVCGYRLVGITARRVADAVVPCGNGGIYTRVDVLDEWLTGQLEKWKRNETREETP